ncbi:hypothetical protein ACJRO7_025637 [Eucalyptus globulus]|uniref:B-like cyclin n=1 Tax=Eucalyptus globulus TaxID=34317 RepID=A0ABD3K9P3_EUCGL
MSNQHRRSSFSSSTTSSLAKRHASSSSSSENAAKAFAAAAAVPSHLAKKRAPLGNLTNLKAGDGNSRSSSAPSTLVANATKLAKTRKGSSTSSSIMGLSGSALPRYASTKPSGVLPSVNPSIPRIEIAVDPMPCSMVVSPSRSDMQSVSLDESMSTCESFKSPDVEYIDNEDVSAVDSIDRKTFSNLYISDAAAKTAVNICERDVLMEMETDEKIVNVDDNYSDPQLCATIACDIYQHLRASEAKKRPSTDFMDRVQKDITASMRAILIDWLVEVAEEYRLVPDTLYLTVNYIDRYLSGNVMNRQRLQLLGVACMMIAAKYEEICAPQVEEFCYITDNTYFKEEVLQMESSVLNYLKFEMTAPTVKCFLRLGISGSAIFYFQVPSLQLECMANYIAELSLLEYDMLCYAPSLVAASAIFLAKFVITPSKRPWDPTLQHYTLYQPSDLGNCVKDLHRLCFNNHGSTLPAIREKYSQHKYKYVAKKYCPPSIPPEFFHNLVY